LEINVSDLIALTKTTIKYWCIEIVANQSTGGSSSTSTSSQVLRFQHLDASARLMMQARNQTGISNSKLESYLTTTFKFSGEFAGRGFDVMDWWKRHAIDYPTLTWVVKQILAVPVSTVHRE
jgi:hypothetical protein